ncbi:MAG: hypothetical protein WDN01_12370 [Rhizomicrobium sp.]
MTERASARDWAASGGARPVQDDNRFFRYVWRFNAVVLALAAIVPPQ